MNELIRRLNSEYELNLPIRVGRYHASPTKTSTVADRIYGKIRQCYFISEPALRLTLEAFQTEAPSLRHTGRLDRLLELLSEQTRSPSGRITRAQTPHNDSQKLLRSQTRKCNTRARLLPQVSNLEVDNLQHLR